ncbi:monocarboxylate transporter 5-like isoform X2 [Stegodyphus dumicola]|uniref:monocarboxylate transporter 5-like isoform X2 n=1 Tax=Stegodyphus dumicola TaxID=202533 RepID=UPI0015A92EDD|nr:monocarboxylate transporter 5-like isoform X2 [Stegodyphus dumicola]
MAKEEEGPDQLRSWAIAIAACVIKTLLCGSNRVTGLFYVVMIETYGVSRSEANLPFTVRNILRDIGGPLAGIIGQRHGPFMVTLLGSFLAALGITLCTFAPNITWICILWGGLHGFGVSLGNTLLQIVVNQYFCKYRASASGLVVAGSCFGSLLCPLLIEYFLVNIGLSGTFLLMGGILLHALPASLMMKNPRWNKRCVSTKNANLKDSTTTDPSKMSLAEVQTAKHDEALSTIQKSSVMSAELDTNTFPILKQQILKKTFLFPKIKISKEHFLETKDDGNPNAEKGIDNPAYQGQRLHFDANTLIHQEKSLNRASVADESTKNNDQQKVSFINEIFEMICHPMFHIISLSLAAYNMLFDPSLAVIVDYAKDKGFENTVAKYFLSLLSLGDLLGKLCFGWMTDRNYLPLPKYMMLLLVVQGVCFLLVPLFDGVHILMTLVVIYGTASGATLVMFPILVENYLVSVQTLAIGCISFLKWSAIIYCPAINRLFS